MAKSRAQRKAEKRRRQQAQQQRQPGRPDAAAEERAQEDTQRGVSGEVAEVEAVIQTGADVEELGEHTRQSDPQASSAPAAPAPSRADVGVPAETAQPEKETREQKRARRKREKEQEKEQARRQRERDQQKAAAEKAEKRRGGVLGFFASCWAELKKVQWPDRDTLVQASAVTLIFVAVMAAYLGGLDAAFNWLIKQIL